MAGSPGAGCSNGLFGNASAYGSFYLFLGHGGFPPAPDFIFMTGIICK
jgi:hypothetical protein